MKFDNIRFSCINLDKWFEFASSASLIQGKNSNLSIGKKDLIFMKKDEYEITFLKVSNFVTKDRKTFIKEDSYIDVKFYCQKSVDEIIDFVFKILEFVNFGTNRSNQVSKIKATSKHKYTRQDGIDDPHSFEIIAKIGMDDDSLSKESDFLFKVNEEINFSSIVNS